MRTSFATDKHSRHIRSHRGAFTLVEVLVALAVMMLLMAIILVPINMGLNVFHIGKARSEVQQANQLVINQLAAELKQAIHVFPNETMPGITDQAPYTADNNQKNQPYYDTDIDEGVTNTARLDFLLPSVDANGGSILLPPRANNYLITYYARRLDDTKAYDVFTNPIVLWRAQYPYQADPSATASASPYVAVNISNTRYDDWTIDSNKWLLQTNGEPNLGPTATTPNFTKQNINFAGSASHTLITPRDMALVSPVSAVPYLTRAQLQSPAVDLNGNSTIEENEKLSYQPDSSFICDDANNDGKIDRVTMSLLLQKYDSIGAADDKSQQIRATQTVSLPNIK